MHPIEVSIPVSKIDWHNERQTLRAEVERLRAELAEVVRECSEFKNNQRDARSAWYAERERLRAALNHQALCSECHMPQSGRTGQPCANQEQGCGGVLLDRPKPE